MFNYTNDMKKLVKYNNVIKNSSLDEFIKILKQFNGKNSFFVLERLNVLKFEMINSISEDVNLVVLNLINRFEYVQEQEINYVKHSHYN